MAESGNKPGYFPIMEQNAATMWTMWHEELEFYMDAIGVKEDEDASEPGWARKQSGFLTIGV